MADSFDRYEHEGSGGGFMMGLLTGTVLGAGLGMLLAPKAGSDLRGAIGEQARNLGNMASEQYRRASEQASGWADRGREFVDKAREAVARGAEETRSYPGGTTGSTYSGTGTTGSSFGGNSGTTGTTSGGFGTTGGSDFGRS
jgi:gas vesicle protein